LSGKLTEEDEEAVMAEFETLEKEVNCCELSLTR
jgi:hypothetical protein